MERNMKVYFALLNFFIINIFGNVHNDFILGYFIYKKTPTVVGFTCNNKKEDFMLMKYFNKMEIKTVFFKLKDLSRLYPLMHTNYQKLGIVIDVHCNDNESIASAFSEAADNRMYDDLHHWLIIMPAFVNVRKFVNDESFDLSTDFVVAKSFNNTYLLYDMYNPFQARMGKLNITLLGAWNKTDGLSIFLTQGKYARRSNLHGMIWRVAYFVSKYRPQNVSLEDHLQDYERTGTKDGLPKFGFSLVKHLSELYNTSIILREYGTWKKGDRSGPMSRALQSNEIDMTGSLISVIPEKLSMLKFVYPAWPFRTCFMFLSPQPQDIKIAEILRPFESSIWCLCTAVSILLGLAITFHVQSHDSDFERYSSSILITIGCMCQQAANIELKLFSTRMVFINIMIFSLLIYNYYSASIVSARLDEPIVKMKDSLVSLAMSDLRLASEPMIYFDFLMKDYGPDADFFNRTEWQKVPESERIMLPDKAMRLVKKGGFAYHAHPGVVYPYVNRFYDNREICELTEVHLGRLSYRSIAIAYNSSFTEITKRGFARISEVGIRHRQLIRWTSRKPLCRNDILSASSITIYEVAPQLIILFMGLIFAVTICGFEILMANYQCNRRLQSKKTTPTSIPVVRLDNWWM